MSRPGARRADCGGGGAPLHRSGTESNSHHPRALQRSPGRRTPRGEVQSRSILLTLRVIELIGSLPHFRAGLRRRRRPQVHGRAHARDAARRARCVALRRAAPAAHAPRAGGGWRSGRGSAANSAALLPRPRRPAEALCTSGDGRGALQLRPGPRLRGRLASEWRALFFE